MITYHALLIIALIVITIIALGTWWWQTRQSHSVEIINFEPPANLDPAQVGIIYSGFADNNITMSLLFYLADQGYLQIEITDPQNNDFILHQLKPYDGDNPAITKFWKGLWYHNPAHKEWLEKRFYKTIDKIKTILNNQIRAKYFAHQLKNYQSTIFFLVSLAVMAIVIFVTYPKLLFFMICWLPFCFCWFWVWLIAEYDATTIFTAILSTVIVELAFMPFFTGYSVWLITSLMFIMIWLPIVVFWQQNPTAHLLAGCMAGLSVTAYANIIGDSLMPNNSLLFYSNVLGIITASLLLLAARSFSYRRNELGQKLYGKIAGFRRFLLIAQKSQLETIIADSPDYFYHTLAYAYALGVSKKWAQKFSDIALPPPKWYQDQAVTIDSKITTNWHRVMCLLDSNLNNRPSPNTSNDWPSIRDGSNRSNGGGGFSGGGHGGGGGGSW